METHYSKYKGTLGNNMKNEKLKALQDKYDADRKQEKEKIRQEGRRFHRLLKWIWYYISYPFK